MFKNYQFLKIDIYIHKEQGLIECRKTKTKVITLGNRKAHRQSSEPIKTRSTEIHVAGTKRGKTCARKSRLVLVLL